MVCSDFDSLMFLFVLSDVLLFSFTFLLLVVTFEFELDSLIFLLVLLLVDSLTFLLLLVVWLIF